jgi:hypothetical protein
MATRHSSPPGAREQERRTAAGRCATGRHGWLPVLEEYSLPFASVCSAPFSTVQTFPSRRVCGHDAQTAMLMGLAVCCSLRKDYASVHFRPAHGLDPLRIV